MEDEQRRQALGQASGIALNQQGGQQALQQQGFGFSQFNPQLGLMQAGSNLLQPGQFRQGLQFDAAQQTAANKAGLLSDIGGLAGSVALAPLTGGTSLLGYGLSGKWGTS